MKMFQNTADNTMNYSCLPLSVGVNLGEEAEESSPSSRRGEFNSSHSDKLEASSTIDILFLLRY